jgi:uncharacterized protein (DUF58 family)
MAFGPDGHGKDAVLTELAVSLARLLTRGGNRVGAILYDNVFQQVIPPGTSRTHVLRLAHILGTPPAVQTRPAQAAWRSRVSNDRAAVGTPTDLTAMLQLAAATARRRSLIFVISDFVGLPGWEHTLGRLAHRHEVIPLRIVDPDELEMPDLGVVVVEDAETGEQLLLDSSDPIFRERFRAEVDDAAETLNTAMTRARVRAHQVSTGEDLAEALVAMVRRQQRRRR